jgi:hypothetical protein
MVRAQRSVRRNFWPSIPSEWLRFTDRGLRSRLVMTGHSGLDGSEMGEDFDVTGILQTMSELDEEK